MESVLWPQQARGSSGPRAVRSAWRRPRAQGRTEPGQGGVCAERDLRPKPGVRSSFPLHLQEPLVGPSLEAQSGAETAHTHTAQKGPRGQRKLAQGGGPGGTGHSRAASGGLGWRQRRFQQDQRYFRGSPMGRASPPCGGSSRGPGPAPES